ncbi:MAG: trypsin-like peptidase domain-containing protein [Hyphomicrobiaceae bacterium]|nr:trypsin-like peptidase domain-containing protein [Hyphomicrobiaceae bacterium]
MRASNSSADAHLSAMNPRQILLFAIWSLLLLGVGNAEELYVKALGPVTIQGENGKFDIAVNGQVIAQDSSFYVNVSDGFPTRKNPKWVLLSFSQGGNCCAPSYKILDVGQTPPRLSASFGGSFGFSYLNAGRQLILAFEDDTWVYSANGLTKMPRLSADESVRLGVEAYKAKRGAEALRYLWPQRMNKNPNAPFYLGLLYKHGDGVARNPKQAMAFFLAAADMGYPRAYLEIASLYASGLGTPQNATKAAEWHRKGATAGDGEAQLNLGISLLNGHGSAPSPTEALFWLLLARDRVIEGERRELADRSISAAEAALQPEQVAKIKNDTFLWKPADQNPFSDPAALRAWVGKHPLQKVKGRQIVEVPELDARVRAAIGDKATEELRLMAGPGKVEERDGWLAATGCMAHDCSDQHWGLYVNLTNYDVLACTRSTLKWPSQIEVFGGTSYQRTERSLVRADPDRCDVGGVKHLQSVLATANRRSASVAGSPGLAPAPKTAERSTGSGYVIDGNGTILTNHHVIDGCSSLAAKAGGKTLPAEMVADDQRNDLAVLRSTVAGVQAAKFREGRGVRAGDSVVAMGYPYAGLLATSPQTTTGTITALAGIGDDSRFLQITAPIQPGNSGGPLFDSSGHVVGTIVSTLNALAVAKVTGSIPQNVNFAIKSGIVREFLDSKNIAYETATSSESKSPADVSELGAKSLVMIECTK